MHSEALLKKVSVLPHEPGIYKFLNEEGHIIYIGKAKNLRHRVGSYFSKQHQANRKTLKLISEIVNLDFAVVNSETDALLLENNLIKENQPKYNILLKDGKTYPYICVTNEPFPRIFPTRTTTDRQHTYYGPYASVKTMNTLLELFRQLFQFRTCSYHLSPQNIEAGKFKTCLEYHIKNCQGPCEGLQAEAAYLAEITQATDILKGHLAPAKAYFKEKMQEAAARLEFEKAAEMKRKLELIGNYQNKSLVTSPEVRELEVYSVVSDEDNAYVNFMRVANGCLVQTESLHIKKKLDEPDADILAHAVLEFRERFGTASPKILVNVPVALELPGTEAVVPKIGDMKKLLSLSFKNAMYFRKERESARMDLINSKNKNHTLIQLKADLNLKDLPRHIECFDNSNIQGTSPVAAMVCFKDGKPAKKEYRHYHIKTVEGPDDFASMYEVVTRRYSRLLAEEAPLPNLVVIDGGKGQLGAAKKALADLGLYGKMPVIGIAKRLEEIYFPGDQLPLHISKKSRSLELLQKLRNEAHRFAITFHRDTRSAASLHSALEDVPGFGPATIKKLLGHYKSMANIRTAPKDELTALIGAKKAEGLLARFGGNPGQPDPLQGMAEQDDRDAGQRIND